MLQQDLLDLINNRINELKYQQVSLRTFIKSDQERFEQIEFAINELRRLQKQVLSLINEMREVS